MKKFVIALNALLIAAICVGNYFFLTEGGLLIKGLTSGGFALLGLINLSYAWVPIILRNVSWRSASSFLRTKTIGKIHK